MIRLTYSSVYDPYHTAFRFLSILSNSSDGQARYDVLRILDFYLSFPSRLSEVHIPRQKGLTALLKSISETNPKSRYEVLPPSKVIFDRISIVQNTAFSALLGNGYVKIEDQGLQLAKVISPKVPDSLLSSIAAFSDRNAKLIELLVYNLAPIRLEGKDGLKARSGLMEYRYDVL